MTKLFSEKTSNALNEKGFESFADLEKWLRELRINATREHEQTLYSVNPAALGGGTLNSMLGGEQDIKVRVLGITPSKDQIELFELDENNDPAYELIEGERRAKKHTVKLTAFENWAERLEK